MKLLKEMSYKVNMAHEHFDAQPRLSNSINISFSLPSNAFARSGDHELKDFSTDN